MTRINANIRSIELVDQHLLAEIRELPRILNTIKSGKAKVDLNKIPKDFKLGSGHICFFYDKLQYLVLRHKDLINEANNRGFNILDYSDSYKDLPIQLLNDWNPTNKDREIVKERINERLSTMKNLRYYKQEIIIYNALIK